MGCCGTSREDLPKKGSQPKSPTLFGDNSFTICDRSGSICNVSAFEESITSLEGYVISEAYCVSTSNTRHSSVLAGAVSNAGADMYLTIKYGKKGFTLMMGNKGIFPELAELTVEQVYFPSDDQKIKLVELLKYVYQRRLDTYTEPQELNKGIQIYSFITGNS